MSFQIASLEIDALERRFLDLSRLSKGKDFKIQQLQGTATVTVDLKVIADLLKDDSTNVVTLHEALRDFVDQHHSPETGLNVLSCYGKQAHQAFMEVLVSRLLQDDIDYSILQELYRICRGLLRESRDDCLGLCKNVSRIFIRRISRKYPPSIREDAIRCLNNILIQNHEVRNLLIQNEIAVDELSTLVDEISILVRDPELSSNSESRQIMVAIKSLFQGDSPEGDQMVARLLLKSEFLSATVERVALALLEAVDLNHKTLKNLEAPLLSTTQEGLARGNLLVDGLRFMYIIANFADDEMLTALLRNEGKPTLSGEDLEACNLEHENLGLGDRYVFLQTQILLQEAGISVNESDARNLDVIKLGVCNLLMFADRAPGFISYLFRRNVGPNLYKLLDRQTTRAKKSDAAMDELLPLVIAIKTLVDDPDGDFKEQFQDLFFENILPDLNPGEYMSQEEYQAAKEKRHFQGRSIPDTVFGKCVQLLTSLHDHVKRYVGELLYTLCDDDPNKVTRFVGFGHAAHLLAIKGGMIGQIMAQQGQNSN